MDQCATISKLSAMNNKRKYIINSLVIFLSLIAGIIICEFTSRFFLGGIIRNDPVLERNYIDALNYKPNQKSNFVSFEWNVNIHINQKGFRDTNEIYNLQHDKVLILGDSFTEGFGIDLNNTFVKKTERKFLRLGKKLSIYNAGISGNNLADYIKIYDNYFFNDDNVRIVLISLYIGNDLITEDQPRYFMGLGDPVGLVNVVERGIDMFDCVLPTRLARHGTVLTSGGRINIGNARFAKDDDPLDPGFPQSPGNHWYRAYLRHLMATDEPTGARILTLHNLAWLFNFVGCMRTSINENKFDEFRKETLDIWS